MTKRIALVTGGNKGLGFEIARQIAAEGITVLIGARDRSAGKAAAERLRSEGYDVRDILLDVTDVTSIQRAAEEIERDFGQLDILINNAGIASPGGVGTTASTIDIESVRRVFDTNFFGALAVTQAMVPLLRRAPSARIINQSSDLGSFGRQSDRFWKHAWVKSLGYSASKAALNMLTVQLATELRDTGITVNSTNPGSTATDLNGNRGQQSVPEGAAIAVRLALMDDAPTGAFLSSEGAEPW